MDNLSVGGLPKHTGAPGTFLEVNPALIAMMEAASKEEMLQHNVSDLYVDPPGAWSSASRSCASAS